MRWRRQGDKTALVTDFLVQPACYQETAIMQPEWEITIVRHFKCAPFSGCTMDVVADLGTMALLILKLHADDVLSSLTSNLWVLLFLHSALTLNCVHISDVTLLDTVSWNLSTLDLNVGSGDRIYARISASAAKVGTIQNPIQNFGSDPIHSLPNPLLHENPGFEKGLQSNPIQNITNNMGPCRCRSKFSDLTYVRISF